MIIPPLYFYESLDTLSIYALLFEKKKVIGIFQKTEWGPRALGNRSIIATSFSDMKEIVNLKVSIESHIDPLHQLHCKNRHDYFNLRITSNQVIPISNDWNLYG